jgi:DNA-binding CsgD family transcriptional regulator
MEGNNLFPWKRILDFIASIGQERALGDMVSRAIAELPSLIPCDMSWAILCKLSCVDAVLCAIPPITSYSMNVPPEAEKAYLNHYYRIDTIHQLVSMKQEPYLFDYRNSTLQELEITKDYVKRLVGINMSAGLLFFDSESTEEATIAIGRAGIRKFSDRDERILKCLQPHLQNLFAILKKQDTILAHAYTAAELRENCRLLSRREAEIASLICRRLRPRQISTLLLLSPRTVERHIENIYDKLDVRNRTQMINRLTTGGEPPR